MTRLYSIRKGNRTREREKKKEEKEEQRRKCRARQHKRDSRSFNITGYFPNDRSCTVRIGLANGYKVRCIIKHSPCIATNATDVRLVRFLQTIVESTKDKITRLHGVKPPPR